RSADNTFGRRSPSLVLWLNGPIQDALRMFGSNNQREVARILTRLMSRTAIERLEVRGEARACQVMPVLLAPSIDGDPDSGSAVCGLITDLSSRGVGV